MRSLLSKFYLRSSNGNVIVSHSYIWKELCIIPQAETWFSQFMLVKEAPARLDWSIKDQVIQSAHSQRNGCCCTFVAYRQVSNMRRTKSLILQNKVTIWVPHWLLQREQSVPAVWDMLTIERHTRFDECEGKLNNHTQSIFIIFVLNLFLYLQYLCK